jgi:hypothetical protein
VGIFAYEAYPLSWYHKNFRLWGGPLPLPLCCDGFPLLLCADCAWDISGHPREWKEEGVGGQREGRKTRELARIEIGQAWLTAD